MPPIFIGITRSFWLMVTALAVMADKGESVVRAFAVLAVTLWSWVDYAAFTAGLPALPEGDPAVLTAWTMQVLPALAFLAALRERAGQSRPYTWRTNRETLT